MKNFLSFIRDESGATAVEYSIMAALIAGVIAFSVGTLGQAVKDLFANFANNYPKTP